MLFIPLVAIVLRLLSTIVLRKAALGFCSVASRQKETRDFVVRHKPSLLLDPSPLSSTQLRNGTRDHDSHSASGFKLSFLSQPGGIHWGWGDRDGKWGGGDWFSQITLLFKSFLIPMSTLLNLKAENGVIIFSSGLTMPFWEERHPKIVVMRKKKRTS